MYVHVCKIMSNVIFQYMYDAVYEWCGHTNRENRLQAFLALEALLQQVRDDSIDKNCTYTSTMYMYLQRKPQLHVVHDFPYFLK